MGNWSEPIIELLSIGETDVLTTATYTHCEPNTIKLNNNLIFRSSKCLIIDFIPKQIYFLLHLKIYISCIYPHTIIRYRKSTVLFVYYIMLNFVILYFDLHCILCRNKMY